MKLYNSFTVNAILGNADREIQRGSMLATCAVGHMIESLSSKNYFISFNSKYVRIIIIIAIITLEEYVRDTEIRQ
jgi:hypothetical protein